MQTKRLLHAGQTNGTHEITEDVLQELAQTWGEIQRAPLTFGRPSGQQEPKAGDVQNVRLADGGRVLKADVRPLPKVRKAANELFLSDPDVAIATASDGRHYLHHVEAGPMPRRVREQLEGIQSLQLADAFAAPLEFSDAADAERHSRSRSRKETVQQM
jgi:hypothetical protein